MKTRLDVLLVDNGLFESREKARAAIMEGLVYVDGAISDKPGAQIKQDALIEIKGDICPFVSRGGYKLQKALDVFGIDPQGLVCLDIGSSTGGFTDCLLQRGAARVYALDVGTNQLAYKLRVDERVVCMEKTNFRTLDTAAFPEKVDFACTDVSFISLKHIFPNASALLKEGCAMVALIKPQFEAGREQVGKKGIIRDSSVHEEVIRNVIAYAEENGLSVQGLDFSPITGTTGNIEFLVHLTLGGTSAGYDIKAVVQKAHGLLEG
ncbi:MAG: TlyA family RNA methyltransferase [Firmicutes bacterium]|nr:TlyA family RNA methyltransferase [Bacillota bacterium]